jgi:hypothetical protein
MMNLDFFSLENTHHRDVVLDMAMEMIWIRSRVIISSSYMYSLAAGGHDF